MQFSDGGLENNPQLKQHFGAFASLRASVSTKILFLFVAYIILVEFFDSFKIYLLSNNFTKFVLEEITIMITFSVCIAFFAYWTLLTHIYHAQYRFFGCKYCFAVFAVNVS